ncbi:MAG: LPS export ABC transporter periplasmic protein LptC [Candidatus Marinimicrobia bacterium]|nr:LPS export ABC transporter periplasmic protein LptC [Candidatus Neomarinimicrobiota bacterium]
MRKILSPFLLIISCSSIENEANMDSRAGFPDQESWDVEITLTDEGIMRAFVKAGHLEKFNDRNYILLNKKVDVDFFDEEEVHTTNLKSMIAEIDEKTNFMTAIDNVVVVSDSGATLYTDTLKWDSKKEIIYTASPIMLTTNKNDTLYGNGFESDVGLNHWKILYPSGVAN